MRNLTRSAVGAVSAFCICCASLLFIPTAEATESGEPYDIQGSPTSQIAMNDDSLRAYVNTPNFRALGHSYEDAQEYLKENSEPGDGGQVQNRENAWSNAYFSSGNWINRDGVWSLSLMPRESLFSGSVAGTLSRLNAAWNTVETQFSSDDQWTDYSWSSDTLRTQFFCHARYILLKTPYNLEPSKETTNIITCN